ncbi:tetratricopeptide repeat protein [Aggregatimonas sangjinii]|uniref:histidine kinase n=1 Tax=Aggregatimonas sangjinii TaxID=2583587 RepID=A0A5B7STZ1_9FLAO|nr:histidine kinase dimerization/phosphoacceptor domain -containing protein [Aggregatimonas sangjinii]QCX00184.1 tetratricopeptide repeat protein [Aggregatimonas sangjinii]
MNKIAHKHYLVFFLFVLTAGSVMGQVTLPADSRVFQNFKEESDSRKRLQLFFGTLDRYQKISNFDWLDQVNIYLHEAQQEKDSAAMADYSLIQVKIYHDIGDYDRSLAIAKDLYKKKDDLDTKTKTILFDLMDDSYAQLDFYAEQIDIRKEKRALGLTDKVSFYDIYGKLGFYDKAMDNYILEEKEKIDELDYVGQAIFNNNIGNYLRLENSVPTALTRYTRALGYLKVYLANITEIKTESDTLYANFLKAIIEGNIGKCLRMMEDWEEAITHLEKSVEGIEEFGTGAYSPDLMENKLELAECYLRLGNYEKATDYLGGSRDPLQIENVVKKNNLLSLYYDKINEPNSALQYLRRNMRIKDSINELKSRLRPQQLKVVVGEDLNNSRAMMEEQRQALEQSKSDILALDETNEIILISLVFVLLLFSGLVYAYLRSIKNQRLIAAQKHIIESSLVEKDSLLKEIHHRVKNNLQMVSSLLSLQTKNTRSKAAIVALEEGKSRVKAMALIHQKLYQNEDLSVIEMQSYIESLINSVQSVYKKGGHNINITIDAEGVELDIDRAIPFGLILNELVSNSFKYAFPTNDENGKIYIHIRKVVDQEGFFEYTDNGIGLPDDSDERANSSMGIRLMNRLANQLQTKLNVDKSTDGVRFWFNFK